MVLIRSILLYVFLLFFPGTLVAQSLEIIDQAEFEVPEESYLGEYYEYAFEFISEKATLDDFGYLATITCTDQYLANCFDRIAKAARKLGANCFTYMAYNFNEEQDEETLTLKVYFANTQLLDRNAALYNSKEVVLYADSYGSHTFYVNNKEVFLKPDSYYSFQIEKDKEYAITARKDQRVRKKALIGYEHKALPMYIPLGTHHSGLDGGGGSLVVVGPGIGGLLAGVLTGAISAGSKPTPLQLPQSYALLLKQIKTRVE